MSKTKPVADAPGRAFAIAAIYGRYSTDNQKATSIDDQVRRCQALAVRHQLVVPPELIFTDSAISGSVTADGRPGYAALMSAWLARKFDVLLVDQQSRLFRNKVEAAQVEELVQNSGIRVIAHAGLDTNSPGWEMIWGMNAIMDAKVRSDTAIQVVRGMDGALGRGCQVSRPPYGYEREATYLPTGERVGGVRFVVVEAQAAVVRRIFAERLRGVSYARIARDLNAEGIPSALGGRWSVSSVVNILSNRLYSGVYAANDSLATRNRLRAGESMGPLARADYLRPELELVSPADFAQVQPRTASVSRTGRGGGKHWASGLATCGVCGGNLAVKAGAKALSLVCPACATRQKLDPAAPSAPYFSGDGLRAVLTYAVQSLFAAPEAFEVFKARLVELKFGGVRRQLEDARAKFDGASRTLVNLTRALSMVDDDDVRATFEADIQAASDAKRSAKVEVERLEAGGAGIAPDVLDAQLKIDPVKLVPLLFARAKPEHLRAVLSRLFPAISMTREAAHGRAALVAVELSPAACAAFLSGTPAVETPTVVRTFRLLTSSRYNTPPVVQLLAADGSVEAATDAKRRCSCCGELKDAEEFGWQNRELQRRHSRCRACASAYYKAWRTKAVEQGLDATKAWRSKDPAQKKLVGAVNKADVVAIL